MLTFSEFIAANPTPPTMLEIRQRTGLSQMAFARRYGVPRRTIQGREYGDRTAPDYELLLLAYAVYTDCQPAAETE